MAAGAEGGAASLSPPAPVDVEEVDVVPVEDEVVQLEEVDPEPVEHEVLLVDDGDEVDGNGSQSSMFKTLMFC